MRRLHFTSQVLGSKATLRLRLHRITQTLRSADEVRKLDIPEGEVVEDSPVEIVLNDLAIGQTDSVAITATRWYELDVEDARRGGFDSVFELGQALKRAGFRYKSLTLYIFYRIRFTWRDGKHLPGNRS